MKIYIVTRTQYFRSHENNKFCSSDLEVEKEKLLIKNKIIEDQADTIKTLKLSIKSNNSAPNLEPEENICQFKNEREWKKKLLAEIEV